MAYPFLKTIWAFRECQKLSKLGSATEYGQNFLDVEFPVWNVESRSLTMKEQVKHLDYHPAAFINKAISSLRHACVIGVLFPLVNTLHGMYNFFLKTETRKYQFNRYFL